MNSATPARRASAAAGSAPPQGIAPHRPARAGPPDRTMDELVESFHEHLVTDETKRAVAALAAAFGLADERGARAVRR